MDRETAFDLKYRVRDLDEIQGNKATIDFIKGLLRENKFPNFTILTGPPGSGKTTVAFQLAKILQCQDRIGYTACGICDSCVGLEETLYTTGAGHAGLDVYTFDMGLNTEVEYITNIAHSISNGTIGGKKIMIIEELQRTRKDSQDTLLRTLEFIPEDTYVIVTTSEPNKIAQAIITRATAFNFSYPSVAELNEYMKTIVDEEGIKITREDLNRLIGLQKQNPRMILKALFNIKNSGSTGIEYLISMKAEEMSKYLTYLKLFGEGATDLFIFIDSIENKPEFVHGLKYFIKDLIKSLYVPISLPKEMKKDVKKVLMSVGSERLYNMLGSLTDVGYIQEEEAEVILIMLAYNNSRTVQTTIKVEDSIPSQVIGDTSVREIKTLTTDGGTATNPVESFRIDEL